MVNVAVLLRGHVRTYHHCYPVLKALILDKFDTDIFIHSWNADEKVLQLYQPKVSVIETTTYPKYFNKLSISYRNQIYANFVLTRKLKEYSETNKKSYDVVMFLRFDTLIWPNTTKIVEDLAVECKAGIQKVCIRPLALKGGVYADVGFITDYTTAIQVGERISHRIKNHTSYSTALHEYVAQEGLKSHLSLFCNIRRPNKGEIIL